MALSADEQKLLDFANAVLPRWFTRAERAQEFLGAAAKMIGGARAQLAHWFTQTRILSAVGATATEPDWLNQHAVDRGLRRQAGESDAALRSRLRDVPALLTRPAILASLQAFMDDVDLDGDAHIIELRHDQAYLQAVVADAGTGGTFSDESSVDFPDRVGFTPDAGWAAPPVRTAHQPFDGRLAITNATAPANDGTFAIVGMDGDKALYDNAAAVPSVDGAADWVAQKLDPESGARWDGHAHSYVDRGFRLGSSKRHHLIALLPFDCAAGEEASAAELLRTRKAAGVFSEVECAEGLDWPTTPAALQAAMDPTATIGLADAIYSWVNGALAEDLVGANDLAKVGAPTILASQHHAGWVGRAEDASLDGFAAAGAGVWDVAAGSFFLVGAVRISAAPGTLHLVHKGGGADLGYRLVFDPGTNRLAWETEDAINGTTQCVVAHALARAHIERVLVFGAGRDATAGDVQLYTPYGEDVQAPATIESLSNAELFSLFLDGAGAGEAGFLAVFMGAGGEGIARAHIENLHRSLGLGGFIP